MILYLNEREEKCSSTIFNCMCFKAVGAPEESSSKYAILLLLETLFCKIVEADNFLAVSENEE